jgi:hypothetical protein
MNNRQRNKIYENESKNKITYDMITLYEFHEKILSYHNILNFWNAKNLAYQFISYNYEFIIFIKMFSWMIFFDIRNNVIPLM